MFRRILRRAGIIYKKKDSQLESAATECLWQWLLPLVDLETSQYNLKIMCSIVDKDPELKLRFTSVIIKQCSSMANYPINRAFIKVFLEFYKRRRSPQDRIDAAKEVKLKARYNSGPHITQKT